MSYTADETYEVYDEVIRTARKPHVCDACKEDIRPGDEYARIGIVFDGEARSLKRCLRCQRIHKHLRSLGEFDQWPDERLDCGQEYAEHWGAEPPDDIAALAFALPGEVRP